MSVVCRYQTLFFNPSLPPLLSWLFPCWLIPIIWFGFVLLAEYLGLYRFPFLFEFFLLVVWFVLFIIWFVSHSPFDHKKPSPPPKSAPYKPVPPPKPKNYRPPTNGTSNASNQQPMTPNSNYWNHSPPGTLNHPNRPNHDAGQQQQQQHGGGGGGGGGYYSHGPPPSASTNSAAILNGHNSYRYEDDMNGGFDSGIYFTLWIWICLIDSVNVTLIATGHGSSLDRHSYGANSLYGKAPPPPPPANGSNRNNQAGQYYYNIPPPREQQQQQSRDGGRLDLAQHRDQRGSAFELYKKPSDPRSAGQLGHPLYMEHNAR